MAEPILFYDGNCALCNNFIKIILKLGTQPSFYFAPLSGKTASEKIPAKYKTPSFDSIVLLMNEQIYTHHKAIFQIISCLPWPFKILLIGQLLPHKLLLNLYQWVAKNRFKWHKKLAICPVPPAKFRHQFIFD
jgi:predicted DCC family thiol-disulfide oxidoreductase YuxK